MDLDEFLNQFKNEVMQAMYRSDLHEIYEIMYPVLKANNGRHMLCFGCGDLVPARDIKSQRSFQLKGKWHCGDEASPFPAILTSKSKIKEYAGNMEEAQVLPRGSIDSIPVVRLEDMEVAADVAELDAENRQLLQKLITGMETDDKSTSGVRTTPGQTT